MRTSKLIALCVLFLLCAGFAGWTIHASGQGRQEPGKMEKEVEQYMPVLRGDVWQKVDHNAKVAFIWGAAHVIAIEQALMVEFPELKKDGFVAKVVEARAARAGQGGSRVRINEVVALIDQFYKDHPDQLQTPVMKIIWDTMIKPNIKTGIGGRPLK
jgi:hypothetical protein